MRHSMAMLSHTLKNMPRYLGDAMPRSYRGRIPLIVHGIGFVWASLSAFDAALMAASASSARTSNYSPRMRGCRSRKCA